MEDRELVQKLLDKSEEAERYFFHAYREKLYRTSVYILGHHDPEAEDVVQEAFMVALRKLPEFEFRSSLNRWLFRICVFLCYERIRKRKRQVLQLEAELENLSSAEQERWKEGDDRRRNALQLVREQRELMGEPCKGLLRLWDEENQSYALIAETLKIPIGTVMSRLNRCKEDLKQLVLRVIKEESNA